LKDFHSEWVQKKEKETREILNQDKNPYQEADDLQKASTELRKTIKIDTGGLKKSVNDLKDTFKGTGEQVKKTSEVFDDATKIKIAVSLGAGVFGAIVGGIRGEGAASTNDSGDIATSGITSPAVNTQQQATRVYAPEITTEVTAQGLFDVFSNNKRQLFALIANGVQTDTNLRNTIRSA